VRRFSSESRKKDLRKGIVAIRIPARRTIQTVASIQDSSAFVHRRKSFPRWEVRRNIKTGATPTLHNNNLTTTEMTKTGARAGRIQAQGVAAVRALVITTINEDVVVANASSELNVEAEVGGEEQVVVEERLEVVEAANADVVVTGHTDRWTTESTATDRRVQGSTVTMVQETMEV